MLSIGNAISGEYVSGNHQTEQFLTQNLLNFYKVFPPLFSPNLQNDDFGFYDQREYIDYSLDAFLNQQKSIN